MRPRRTVHHGSVLANGIAIDALLVGEAEARARIVRLSASTAAGSAVFRLGSTLVLRLPTPMRVNCAASPGTPLVRYGRLLSAAPLAPDEQKTLEAHEETVVLMAGGAATLAPLHDDTREDVSQWIDVSEFRVGDALLPLSQAASDAPREQFASAVVDVRRSLGMGPLDEAGGQLLAALKQRDATRHPGSGGGRASRGSWFARLSGGLAALRSAWRSGARPAGAGAVTATPAVRNQPRPARHRPGLRELLARALWSSKLGGLIGRQHARYLMRMLAMFDEGDLDGALRHAIPLGKELETGPFRLPLWLPSPRRDLSITPQQAAGASFGVGGSFFSYLQQRYRQAFERLSAAGEIEKAAFVLAELLNASEEAVLFLERHGRLRLAAEIAEVRNLPAGLVIRQWFLAGERARAIAIAQRTGAFADAVARLTNSHREEATVLRLLWADALASGGLYAAAVDVAWPVESARNLVLDWIDRAIAIGGPSGARMLARKASLRPEEFAEICERAQALLAADGEDARSAVIAFARELVTGGATGETRILARATARRILRDRAGASSEGDLAGLLRVCGDAFFQDDVRS